MPSPDFDIRGAVQQLYAEADWPQRVLCMMRPLICPFSRVANCVPMGSTVLDVGCGSGIFLNTLAHEQRISSGLGVDFSSRAIDTALTAAKQIPERLRPKFFCGSANEISWNEPLSVITIIDLLHHIPANAQRCLVARLAEKVDDKGCLIVKDIAPRPRWRAWANRIHDLLLTRQWVSYVEPSALENWMRELGFTLSHREQIDMLWYRHDIFVFVRDA